MKPLLKYARSFTRLFGVDMVRYAPGGRGGSNPPDFSEQDARTIQRVQPYTYTSPERIWALCNAVEYLTHNNVPGSIVECGVWRGGSMMAAMLTLLRLKDTSRECYLYDTYEGMPPPSPKDIAITGQSAEDAYSAATGAGRKMTYSALEDVKKAIASTGYPLGKVNFIKGRVEETIPESSPGTIALLRLDTDWYASTKHELVHLYPRLSPGGVLIIDDYGHWAGAREATDEYFKKEAVRILLNRIDYTGRIGVKQ